jgi:hypothetical protein
MKIKHIQFNQNWIKHSILLAVISFSNLLQAQQIAPGQWRDHFAYSNKTKVLPTDEKIYCIASEHIFTVSKTDNSVEKLSKVNGLSDLSVTAIGYYKPTETLIIGYDNGNIDLVCKNKIININDLKNKITISAKKINNIFVINNLAYLCCEYGILVLNMDKNEIKDSYQFGAGGTQLKVFDLCLDGNQIIAATEKGLYQANTESANLADYNSWQQISEAGSNSFSQVEKFGNRLFAINNGGTGDNVIYRENGSWKTFQPTVSATAYPSLWADDARMVITGGSNIMIYDTNLNLTYSWSYSSPVDAVFDGTTLCVCDKNWGLMVGATGYGVTSPLDNNVCRIAANNGKIWIAPGSKDQYNWNPVWRGGSAYYYDGTSWSNFNRYSLPVMDNFFDICNIVFDKSNPNKAFLAGWTTGYLAEFNNNSYTKTWDNTNTDKAIETSTYSRIYGMCYDNDNNLWLARGGMSDIKIQNPIVVKTPSDKWYSFNVGDYIGSQLVGNIISTQSGNKWVVLPRSGGLFAFNGKIENNKASYTEAIKFSVLDADGATISNDIYSIAEDLDGNIWVGTNSGPVVYYTPDNVFTQENFYASQIKISSKINSGYADLLLSNERITAIAIDGANRKWLGTSLSGVFLMSADGTKEIHNFTSTNSPLPSNTIVDIAIDQVTGEVYFATDLGTVSYKGEATEGGDDFGKVYVYPNPVREGYNGDIVITGMVRDAIVRITDMSGNLVYSTTSLGGQAIWKGRTNDGRKVSTGVYQVFCSSKDGSKTTVTKLLFIR